ncbi:hypothetical protein RhiJN_11358 [Ceratobasidium sp. AG-Ba]|nr:hypothetical protein RhiJN_11358 [Ceratobasidium sp. AG-Ba]QRW12078.1 hypothetical protein RhiLY_11077 [Ceratobasidium sp. AG-Ba]
MATIYAQPTKEWVIPAKPKPGRKPKRDEPVEDEEGGSDFKAKKVQNRAAQRAFRERKQSQLADLQARLTQYEQGEIERNVALQNVAKKLKEENERLKSDNEKLREEGDRVRQENMLMRTRLRELQEEFSAYRRSVDPSTQLELEAFINSRKRSRTDSSASSSAAASALSPTSSSNPPVPKRKRTKDDKRSPTPTNTTRGLSSSEIRRKTNKGYNTLPADYAPPPQPTFTYSPASTATSSRPSLVMSSGVSENSSVAEPSSFDTVSSHADATIRDFGSDLDENSDDLNVVDCGFCSKEPDECVCRAVRMDINQLIDSTSSTSPNITLPSNPSTVSGGTTDLATDQTASPSTTKPSILDNLPPVQPGVPLKLRRSKQLDARASMSLAQSELIRLTPVPQFVQLQTDSGLSTRPVCSGDPSNCAACANDSFGRAFCTALANGDVCRDANCTSCPKTSDPSSSTGINTSKDSSKGKSIPMDVDVSSTSGLGLGVGMETGMLLCCGDPKLCGGGGCSIRTSASPSKALHLQQPPLPTAGSPSNSNPRTSLVTDIEDMVDGRSMLPSFTSDEHHDGNDKGAAEQDIPTNEAWARLKAHPNVAFADLALLADVVARRTKCTGPRIVLSPTPKEDTETSGDEDERKNTDQSMNQDGNEIESRISPRLVPHAALVRCGRERLMRVQAEGVRDALAMLDVQRPT